MTKLVFNKPLFGSLFVVACTLGGLAYRASGKNVSIPIDSQIQNNLAANLPSSGNGVTTQAIRFKVLHTFTGTGGEGKSPQAGLVEGSDGNFYGTTATGGNFSCGTFGSCGTVFKITPSGTLTTLVKFNNTNGSTPRAGLLLANDGNFYGTTSGGGTSGKGTVFKVDPSGTLTTLVNFNITNGSTPTGELIQGNDGNFYGTASAGGTRGGGTVFRMKLDGTLKTLVNFVGTNGSNPLAGLIQASDGNFYGTTRVGGTPGAGTVFRMRPNGTLKTLVNFNNTNGSGPNSKLLQGSNGQLYGTTAFGGTSNLGTIFRMSLSGNLKTLVNFNRTNGERPDNNGLIQASNGNFYGMTTRGGSSTGSNGTIYRLSRFGILNTLFVFGSGTGSSPRGELLQASDGFFYGTTSSDALGRGNVFRFRLRCKCKTIEHSPSVGKE
jgi:uncharacterized repeat protein (TIGR03803 family)